jgi:hypothetical protein
MGSAVAAGQTWLRRFVRLRGEGGGDVGGGRQPWLSIFVHPREEADDDGGSGGGTIVVWVFLGS